MSCVGVSVTEAQAVPGGSTKVVFKLLLVLLRDPRLTKTLDLIKDKQKIKTANRMQQQ